MKLRHATTLSLLSFVIISFQNCSSPVPTSDEDFSSSTTAEDDNAYDSSTFSGGGSSTIPIDNSSSNNNSSSTFNPSTIPSTINVPSSNTPTSTSTIAVPAEARVSIYRVYNSQNGDHLFTRNQGEATILDQTPEWTLEGIAFVLLANPGNNRQPVYRCYNPVAGEHYVSHDANCEAQGMIPEGVLGYVSLTLADTSSAPLYRCISVQFPVRHLASTNGTECTGNGFRIEAQYGFVMPPNAAQ